MAADHPLRAEFVRLTRLEDAMGLYANASRIGTQDGWMTALAATRGPGTDPGHGSNPGHGVSFLVTLNITEDTPPQPSSTKFEHSSRRFGE